jgi:protease-4
MAFPGLTRPKVAVVEVYGTIGGSVRSRHFAPMFKALRENKQVRAVVLDIDSPGGSASESDYLYRSLQLLAAQKPLVAFIRGVGASGSYFLACAGQRIVAQRSSVVGSIGVITIRPQVQELLGKMGVQVNVTATGPLKGMGLPFRPESEEERTKNQAMVDAFFQHFIAVVAEGRHVPETTVRDWATGEVFWGKEALAKGLVDELGELEDAIAVAAKLGHTPEKNVVAVRPRIPLGQRLMQRVASASTAAVRTELERLLAPRIEYR